MMRAPDSSPPVASDTEPRTVAAIAGLASRRLAINTLVMHARVIITTDSCEILPETAGKMIRLCT
jgi:hypothetical protein